MEEKSKIKHSRSGTDNVFRKRVNNYSRYREPFQLASTICDETTVIHVMADDIDTYKSEDSFVDPVLNKRYCLNACDRFERGEHTLLAKFKTRKV